MDMWTEIKEVTGDDVIEGIVISSDNYDLYNKDDRPREDRPKDPFDFSVIPNNKTGVVLTAQEAEHYLRKVEIESSKDYIPFYAWGKNNVYFVLNELAVINISWVQRNPTPNGTLRFTFINDVADIHIGRDKLKLDSPNSGCQNNEKMQVDSNFAWSPEKILFWVITDWREGFVDFVWRNPVNVIPRIHTDYNPHPRF